MTTPTYHYSTDVAAALGVTERYLNARIRALGVPHLDLGRGRIRLTDTQLQALHNALQVDNQPTARSRNRRRKGAA